MAGRSTLALKAEELGLELDSDALRRARHLKALEYRGYHFEVADGSLELLLRKATGWEPEFFEVESFRVINDHAPTTTTGRATVGRHDRGDGQGPRRRRPGGGHRRGERSGQRPRLGAAPGHRRRTIPELAGVHLVDYRVRVLDTGKGTGAVTRVLIDTTDGERVWTTIGVSENIIEASWQALFDSIVYGLVHAEPGAAAEPGRPRASRTPPMTQPNFVPIVETDQVRPSYRLRTPPDWRGPVVRRAPRARGVPGPRARGARARPGLRLAAGHALFEDRLELTAAITAEDALVGCCGGGEPPAPLFGRAPVAKDIELAWSSSASWVAPPPTSSSGGRRCSRPPPTTTASSGASSDAVSEDDLAPDSRPRSGADARRGGRCSRSRRRRPA